MTAPGPVWLFDASGQSRKVIGITWFSLVCALGSSWAAWGIWLTFGTSPADGGVLRAWPERLAVAALVAALGWGFVAAMVVYLRCYVLRIWKIDPETVELQRLWPAAKVRIGAGDRPATRYHPGQFRSRRAPSVAAPWTALRVPGRRLPYLVDEQGQWNSAVDRPGWLR